MREIRESLLVVAVPSKVVGRFPPILWRDSFDVTMVDNPRLAIKAIDQRVFSLIISSYPLPNMEFQRFLDEIRAFGSPCRKCPVLAVVAPSEKSEVDQYVGRGLNRVALVSDTDNNLAESIASILNVAPRIGVRLPIDLQTQLYLRNRKMMAQTINVSRTGFLITDPGSLDLGDRIEFRFDTSGAHGCVSGTAEVVRVDRKRQNAAQIGMHILDFDEGDEVLFFCFVDELLANDHHDRLPLERS